MGNLAGCSASKKPWIASFIGAGTTKIAFPPPSRNRRKFRFMAPVAGVLDLHPATVRRPIQPIPPFRDDPLEPVLTHGVKQHLAVIEHVGQPPARDRLPQLLEESPPLLDRFASSRDRRHGARRTNERDGHRQVAVEQPATQGRQQGAPRSLKATSSPSNKSPGGRCASSGIRSHMT